MKRPGLCVLPYCAPLFKLQGFPQVPGRLQDGLGVGKHTYLKNSKLWSCGSAAPIVSTGAGPGVLGLVGPPRGAEVRVTVQALCYVSFLTSITLPAERGTAQAPLERKQCSCLAWSPTRAVEDQGRDTFVAVDIFEVVVYPQRWFLPHWMEYTNRELCPVSLKLPEDASRWPSVC